MTDKIEPVAFDQLQRQIDRYGRAIIRQVELDTLIAERDALQVELGEYQQAAGMLAIERGEFRIRAERAEAEASALREGYLRIRDASDSEMMDGDMARSIASDMLGGK